MAGYRCHADEVLGIQCGQFELPERMKSAKAPEGTKTYHHECRDGHRWHEVYKDGVFNRNEGCDCQSGAA